MAATIDFAGLPTKTSITSITTAVTNVSISATGGKGEAWVFNTNSPTGNDTDLGAPFDRIGTTAIESYRPGNVLIIQDSRATVPNDFAGGGILSIVFGEKVTLESLNVFDMNAGSIIKLFDETGLLRTVSLGNSEDVSCGSGCRRNRYEHLVFTDARVTSFELHLAGSGAIGDIQFSAVPIPAAVWLFGSALLGLAGVGYRRQGARVEGLA
ncbi:VPLPA-CTERM sorting domain-containing protein [Thiocystis violacea]|uniref:VPLPA-CTERM sorting domain-containing protein n=1 Tax=Thiocystis violacea TaxID=13725 RepID=UPI001A938C20|nr:VPLPA-CTERM sorting domain-containing protein [Thiocystis violacea]